MNTYGMTTTAQFEVEAGSETEAVNLFAAYKAEWVGFDDDNVDVELLHRGSDLSFDHKDRAAAVMEDVNRVLGERGCGFRFELQPCVGDTYDFEVKEG